MDYYYSVLELAPGASETEIKKAYRRLARQYHPDVSTLPDAEERFVQITEAYDQLLNRPAYQSVATETTSPVVDRERQRRDRARQHARKRYEEFRQSTLAFKKAWYFMPLKILTNVLILCLYALALAMLVSPLVALIVSDKIAAVIGFAFLAIVSVQVYQVAQLIRKGTSDYFEDWE